MKVAKEAIPAEIDSPAAIARHQRDFGDTTDYGDIAAEYFSLKQGTDITGLLEGLENNHCQSPHWEYVIRGELTVTYTDGSEEVDEGGDMYYWPPGHTVRADEDTDVVMEASRPKPQGMAIELVLGGLALFAFFKYVNGDASHEI